MKDGKIFGIYRETKHKSQDPPLSLCSDTGHIENDILLALPENMIRGYRVAKYIIQDSMHRTCVNPLNNFDRFKRVLGKGYQRKDIFGYTVLYRSYYLRCLFLLLLKYTHGTAEYEYLHDGTLVMCLLSMVKHILERD